MESKETRNALPTIKNLKEVFDLLMEEEDEDGDTTVKFNPNSCFLNYLNFNKSLNLCNFLFTQL